MSGELLVVSRETLAAAHHRLSGCECDLPLSGDYEWADSLIAALLGVER